MLDNGQVLSAEQIRKLYGTFYTKNPYRVSLDPSRVPKSLHILIPYAEFWGIADDGYREDVVMKAPRDILENLKSVVAQFDDEMDDWLAGDEADDDDSVPSEEYVAFSAMRMVADFA